MARGKKKESALTPEEKLAQALVPAEEQPYQVPKNWCWTKAGNMVTLHRGVSYKKDDAHTEKGENDCLIMRGGNISEGGIDTDADNVYVNKDLVTQEQLVKKHDVIIVSSTGSTKVIGRAGISLMDYDDVAFGAFLTLLRPVDYVSKTFVDYYFQSDLYRERVRSLASGVNINNIRTEYITESPVPLPPLAEQQRIVDRIEYLFAKLDEAKEKAQSVLDSFETSKAAILHKAFTGELTAKWRAEHDVGMNSWKEQTIVDLCSLIVDCPHSTPEWTESGKVCLRTTNIKDGYLDLAEVRYVSEDTFCRRNQRAVPLPGDVLLTREGSIGDVGVIPDGWEICLGQRMMLLRPEKCKANFLVYFFRNPKIISDIRAETMGSTAPRMNIKELKKLKIACPDTLEQTEIVRILDSLFAKKQQAKEAAEAVLEKIDLLKKSILARAFRGELGTNDPTEESALELLKTVL
jgi:type I restriction enzyme S subunit